jgi:protocatechuate 3,4-dioxygenase beta subunit
MNKQCLVLMILLLLSTTIGHGLAQKDLGIEDATITVTDKQGNALPNVKVTELASMKEYITDDSGRFKCDLSNDRQYFYAIDKERKLINRGTLKPDQRQLQIRLEPARIITGKVVDADGRPVPGATIDKIPSGPCVLSDNEGNFVTGWLPSQKRRSSTCLVVRNIERNLAVIVDISRHTENIEIELAPALTLKGKVANLEGRPVSEARMILTLKKWSWGIFISKRIYVDDKGRFEFPVLPQLQEYEISIRAENYLDESFTIGHLNTIKEVVEIAPVVLHQKQDTANGIEYGELFLNVVDEDGKPIDITEIQFWDAKDHASANKETLIAASTDKPGFYRIEKIPTGYYHVISINEEGYAPFQQTDVLIEKDSTKTINCILSRGGTIEGLVINDQGKPVEGIPVLIKSPLYCKEDLITDANGRFHADSMPDMHYSVVVEPESESVYETTVFRGDVLCGQKDIKIIVQNKKGTRLGASLVGRNLPEFEGIKINLKPDQTQNKKMLICIFDYQQRPARNCIMQLNKQVEQLKQKGIAVIGIQATDVDIEDFNRWLETSSFNFPIGMIEGDTDEIEFNWSVQSLPWLILTDKQHIVQAEGFSISELDTHINEKPSSSRTITDSNRVTGIVKNPEGQILAGVRVTEYQTDKQYTTNKYGEFTSAYDPSDERRVFFAVDKQNKLVGVGRLAAGRKHVEIKLAPARMVSGTVVDTEGKPVAGAQVAPMPMTCYHVLTDAQGKFDVGWNPKWAGDLKVFFLMARHLDRNLASGIEISTETENIRIELKPALTLTGTIEDPNSEPIAGAKVNISLIRGWGAGTPVRKVITDKSGRFEIPTLLQKQEYGIGANAEGYWRNVIKTGIINKITDREDIGTIILKRPILSVSGIVVDGGGKPVANIPVYLHGDGQPNLDSKTNGQGKFKFEKVCSGPVQISAKNQDLFGIIDTQGGAENVRIIVTPRFEPNTNTP